MSEKRIYKGLVLNDYGEGKNYATYVKEGTKLIETRMNRLFSFRGDVVICCGAGKSVTPNAGKALCIVEVWKGREMLPTDVEAARIEWHPKRKSHLLRNWRYFSENFEFAPMAIQKNFQGMFDMAIPDHVEIIPRPDIIPFDEPEEQTQPTLFESKPQNDMSQKLTGVELIAEERKRQIEKEGWSARHDAEHTNGEMALAAAAYTLPNIVSVGEDESFVDSLVVRFKRFRLWPWESKWWKPEPRNRVRELVKAGALIAAEIDRLQNTQP